MNKNAWKVNLVRDEKILKKCLDIYERRKSVRPVYAFFDRLDAYRDHDVLYDRIMTEIQKRYFPGFTVKGFVSECLDLFHNGTSLEWIYELAREEMPLTADDYYEWEPSFSEKVQKLPKSPTAEQWEHLEEWISK